MEQVVGAEARSRTVPVVQMDTRNLTKSEEMGQRKSRRDIVGGIFPDRTGIKGQDSSVGA